MNTPPRLQAFQTGNHEDMPIRPAALVRDWMDATPHRFAYRCLPMVIANQYGWAISNPTTFGATWNGGEGRDDVVLLFSGRRDDRISSHFGAGIVTFTIPYLFRTPPGVSLWIKGPTNHCKDGVHALEGIVETDSTAATFTMNWKLTRADTLVRFEAGEPIAMIMPLPQGYVEAFEAIQRPLHDDPDLVSQHDQWKASRQSFNHALAHLEPDAVKQQWQRDYLLGRDGDEPLKRQTRVEISPFRAL